MIRHVCCFKQGPLAGLAENSTPRLWSGGIGQNTDSLRRPGL